MTVYSLILLIHIIAAVCGLGATFALPIIMKLPKTVSQAKFAFEINEKVEVLAKIGSFTLLGTGLLMGFLNLSLFKEIWFDASLAIYILIQPIVAKILPDKIALQMKTLEDHEEEALPEEYKTIAKQMIPYNNIAHIAAIVLIILMTLKPF